MLDQKTESAIVISSANVDLDKVPILIATYLPVEICVYYQVVPVNIDGSLLILGMVDEGDLAALDYVGKMLAFSQLQIHIFPLSFEQHQELVAYYFNNPPTPAQLAEYQPSKQESSDTTAFSEESSQEASIEEGEETESSSSESEESVQQLLNSILRRALDEQADRVFIEINDDGSCRVRYRQKGILRDLFKDLSNTIREQLILSLKAMLGMDTASHERQSAAVEKVYRGEALVLQLRIVVHQEKEGAILNILQGEALDKYQHQQNQRRVTETLAAIERAQAELVHLHDCLSDTVDKVQRYSGQIQPEWINVAPTLEALMQKTRQIQELQKTWVDIQKS